MDKVRKQELIVAGITAWALAGLIILVDLLTDSSPNYLAPELEQAPIAVFPDFVSIRDVDVKKQQFFDYLQSYIDGENEKVAGERAQLLSYVRIFDSNGALSEQERDWVYRLADRYRIDMEETSPTLAELLQILERRVDVIPTSLVLAQAANESAWGTSRFAQEGFNLFGQWCFEQGCGFVPRRREEGATHEVKRFDSVEGAIESYFLNINTHYSYRFFRDLRLQMRKQNKGLDSVVLAFGLGRYSERGDNYIDEVQNIIIQNNLLVRDRVHSPV